MVIRYLALVALVAACTAVPLEESEAVKARFDNYKVFRVIPANEEQVKILQQIEEKDNGFSFWTSASQKGKPTDIMVPPHKLPMAMNMFKTLNLKHHIMVQDVQRLIDEERPKSRASGGFDWNDYYRVDVIYDWLDSLAAQYPDKVTTVIGGQSYENRQIKGVKYSTGGSGKRLIFVDGGMHAREWISPAVNTYMLNEVVTNQDPNVRALVDSFDWYFFPVINPDGYEYSQTTDRMWRKTRGPGNMFCVGTDPNRNYGFHWSLAGASDNPCSETYHGSGPFSEVETKSFSDFITPYGKDIDVYLSLHSFSQLMLFPMGYTDQHLPDFDNMLAAGQRAAAALATRYGTSYNVGNIVDILYVASGSNLDWVKGVFNTTLPFVFELRDTGEHGFLLPASEIIPSGKETFDGLLSLAKDAQTTRAKKQ